MDDVGGIVHHNEPMAPLVLLSTPTTMPILPLLSLTTRSPMFIFSPSLVWLVGMCEWNNAHRGSGRKRKLDRLECIE